MSVWRARAQQRIAELTANLPAHSTLAERRRVLRGQGWDSGWAQKVWHQECRAYLALHGDTRPSKRQRPFPDDVHFPFRGEANA